MFIINKHFVLFIRLFGSQVNQSGVEFPFASHRWITNLASKRYIACVLVKFLSITCTFKCANFGSLEQAGLARNRLWSLDDSPAPLPPANSQSTVDLMLKSTEEDLKSWPHRWGRDGMNILICSELGDSYPTFNLVLVLFSDLNYVYGFLWVLASWPWSLVCGTLIARRSRSPLLCAIISLFLISGFQT